MPVKGCCAKAMCCGCRRESSGSPQIPYAQQWSTPRRSLPTPKEAGIVRKITSHRGAIMRNSGLLALACVLSLVGIVQAAEVQIIAGGGIVAPLTEIARQFEGTPGQDGDPLWYDAELIKMATAARPSILPSAPGRIPRRRCPRSVPTGCATNVARVDWRSQCALALPSRHCDPGGPQANLAQAQAVASIPASATGTSPLASTRSSASPMR